MPLYAGVCETNITPPVGVWMSGYAFRSTGSVGVHDELYARALALTNGRVTLAVISTDLIGLDQDLVARVRSGVEAQLGIPAGAVMVNSTHTHGGPSTCSYNAMGPRDEAYVDVLARKLIGTVKQAVGRMQPASVGFGRAPVQIGVNRRQPMGGTIRIGANFAGPVDTDVRVLVVRDSRGEPFAAAFSHACHGTTMGGDNLQTTGDWCAAACEAVKRETAGAVTPLFLQGCCGNINPYPRGTFEHVRAHGDKVGLAVLEAMEGSRAARLAEPEDLDFEETTIELPLIPPPAREECQARLDGARKDLEAERTGGNVGRILHAEGMVNFAEKQLSLCGQDAEALRTPFLMQRLTVAGHHLLGMPGEVMVQYALDFDRQSRMPVLVLGYTNGVLNYVPTAADYELGGYEVSDAYVYYNSLMFASDCEKLIREAAYDLLGIEQPNRAPYRV